MEPLEAALALEHPPVPVAVLAAVAEPLAVVARVVLVPHQRVELVRKLLPRGLHPVTDINQWESKSRIPI